MKNNFRQSGCGVVKENDSMYNVFNVTNFELNKASAHQ
jgi:hypothetical protein